MSLGKSKCLYSNNCLHFLPLDESIRRKFCKKTAYFYFIESCARQSFHPLIGDNFCVAEGRTNSFPINGNKQQ